MGPLKEKAAKKQNGEEKPAPNGQRVKAKKRIRGTAAAWPRKVYPLAALVKIRRRLKREGKTVVFTNGCFDLLHAGHIRLFREAKRLGDVLVVALNRDASVRKIKGPDRPIYPLRERLEILEAIEDIDFLTSFGEASSQKIIATLLPDVLIKGGDWGPHQVVGRETVEAAGGKVVQTRHLKGHSTSAIVSKIVRLTKGQAPER